MELNLSSSYLPLLQEQIVFRDSDFGKQVSEAFKTLEKKHAKRLTVNTQNAKLIEDHLLPMLVVQDKNSGEIVCQVFSFAEYFQNKLISMAESNYLKVLTSVIIDAEKLLKIKGVLEPDQDGGRVFENKKEELEHQLSVGSSYLQDQLNNEEVETLNRYIYEHERIIELTLNAATVNYRDSLIENFREVQDPFGTEIKEIEYNQNPADPSQVVRQIIFRSQHKAE